MIGHSIKGGTISQITWDFFLVEFRKKYISSVYLDERRRELMSLTQRQ